LWGVTDVDICRKISHTEDIWARILICFLETINCLSSHYVINLVLLHIILVSKICFNLGKKSGGEKEEQATGGKDGKKSSVKEEGSGEQQAVPSGHKHQKKKTPALGLGVDVTAGPSQQPPTHVAGM
jgi:hypothetical protein